MVFECAEYPQMVATPLDGKPSRYRKNPNSTTQIIEAQWHLWHHPNHVQQRRQHEALGIFDREPSLGIPCELIEEQQPSKNGIATKSHDSWSQSYHAARARIALECRHQTAYKANRSIQRSASTNSRVDIW